MFSKYKIIAIPLLLAGCIPAGDIKPSSMRINENTLAMGASVHQAGRAAWPQEKWWEAYRDPQLSALVETAIGQNPNLQTAQARLRQAQAAAETAGASLAPRVDASLSMQPTHWSDDHYYPKGFSGKGDWNNQAALGLLFDLDLWGRHRSEAEGALDQAQVAEAEAQAARLALEGAVVQAYIQLSLQYRLEDIVQRQIKQEQSVCDITARRLSAGLSTDLEMSQAEVPLPALRAQAEKIAVQMTVLRNQLAALIGQGPGAGEQIKPPVLSLEAKPIVLPSVIPAQLVGRRPDVVAHRWQVEAAGKNIDAAQAQFMPNINLMASFGSAALTPGVFNFVQSSALTYAAGPAVTLPIFDAGRLRGNLSSATAGYDAAVSSYNDTVIHALEAIANQIAQLKSLAKQSQETRLAVRVAQKSEDITRRGYIGGLTEYLGVLNAEKQLFEAQKQAASVQAEQWQAYALLAQALGGGLNAPQEKP